MNVVRVIAATRPWPCTAKRLKLNQQYLSAESTSKLTAYTNTYCRVGSMLARLFPFL